MAQGSSFHSLATRPLAGTGSSADSTGRYPACPLAARPLTGGSAPLSWEDLLGQR